MTDLKRKIWSLIRGGSFKGYLRTLSGYPLTITNCMENGLISLTVNGNSVQSGTPSVDHPSEIMGVGNRTKNLFDKNQEPINRTANQVIYGIQLNKNTSYTLYITSDAVTYINLHPDENRETSELVARREVGSYYIKFDSGENTYLSIRFTKALISEKYLSKMVLTEGTFGASDKYEPYGYKLPLIMSSKNLYTGSDFTVQHNNQSVTINLQDGEYTVAAVFEATSDGKFVFIDKHYTGLQAGNTYTFICNVSKSFTLNIFGTINNAYVKYAAGTLKDIQILEGSYTAETIPPYEPYHEPQSFEIYKPDRIYIKAVRL